MWRRQVQHHAHRLFLRCVHRVRRRELQRRCGRGHVLGVHLLRIWHVQHRGGRKHMHHLRDGRLCVPRHIRSYVNIVPKCDTDCKQQPQFILLSVRILDGQRPWLALSVQHCHCDGRRPSVGLVIGVDHVESVCVAIRHRVIGPQPAAVW